MDTITRWKQVKKHFLSECEMANGTMVVNETGNELSFSKEYGEKATLYIHLEHQQQTNEPYIIFGAEGHERGFSQWVTEEIDFPKVLEKAFRNYGYTHRKACQMRLF